MSGIPLPSTVLLHNSLFLWTMPNWLTVGAPFVVFFQFLDIFGELEVEWIKMPQTRAEALAVARAFSLRRKRDGRVFPPVLIGLVDGVHVYWEPPFDAEKDYVNRHGTYCSVSEYLSHNTDPYEQCR